jgi:hypothetical protein
MLRLFFNVRKFRKKREVEALTVLCHYLDEGFGELLLLDLNEETKRPEMKDSLELALLLNSKQDCLIYLTHRYHEREFFGNFLPLVKQIAERLRFLTLEPNRAKRKVRHRGYRDHGSCTPNHRWLPKADYSFTEGMNRIEQERARQAKIFSNLRTFGALGVRLSVLEN